MDEERKHIMLIACHGWVYDNSRKEFLKNKEEILYWIDRRHCYRK